MNKLSCWMFAAALLAAPLSAQTLQTVRIAPPPIAAPPSADAAQSIVVDYKAKWEKEREKTAQLQSQLQGLSEQLAAYTGRGGSLVHAYCETPTLSRNTAGASNDCAASGYTCEPVSGLCRTSSNNSSECAAGYLYCATNSRCVPATPDACR